MNTRPVYFLLVDDLEENLVALEALLRREGLKMLKARSGTEALELLLIHDVALAMIDVQMPEMDGFELAELIRGAEITRRVPIIFLTAGNPDPQRRFRGYEAGAVDFIRKPIEADVLRSKADVFYELARQRDELRCATEENARLLAESRRQADALREADRRKDEFLATLAHELRNPLAPIRNAVSVMRAKELADDDREALREMIDRQAKNMARLVDELMDVARISTGKVVLRKSKTELRPLINYSVELAREAIDRNRHQLEVMLPEAPVYFEADEVRLTQVLCNLLTNAAKYSEPGGRIQIHGAIEDDNLIIQVKDSGIGIPEEMLAQVFDLFTQVDRSLDRAQGGLGVGLALVRRLVELHDGTITAESPGLGCGSVFTVTIPMVMCQEDIAAMPTLAIESEGALQSDSKLRVLIVDDNADGAKTLSMLIKLKGNDTMITNTGLEGLKAAHTFLPHVVFLDIGLPEMSGYEIAQTMRRDPRFAKTMLIALTGWATEKDKEQAEKAGFDFHFTKPIDSLVIDEIIGRLRCDKQ